MENRNLPLGVQGFPRMRRGGFLYVDKTDFAERLAKTELCYFLSRPRRFGKSLLVSTLKELFEGNEKLFKGLAIHGNWDWSVRYPVIRLDFSAGVFNVPGLLEAAVDKQLSAIEEREGIGSSIPFAPVWLRRLISAFTSARKRETPFASVRFGDLISALAQKYGQRVVLLVDEYDKPILDALSKPEIARANRDFLYGIYSNVKQMEDDLRFCLITGISRFAKVGLFSSINNLIDISLDPEYSSICGYTESDIDRTFEPELSGLDRAEIRRWYNGYCWTGKERVYNPYSILYLLGRRKFDNWWYQTGMPTFLADALVRDEVYSINMENMHGSTETLSAFDIDKANTAALLFQTGYLTIVEEERIDNDYWYHLDYPNLEVRRSLNKDLLQLLIPDMKPDQLKERSRLGSMLEAEDFSGLQTVLKSIFANVPHQWHAKGELSKYEAYFATAILVYFLGAGVDARTEESTSEGRIDLAVVGKERVYLFEFKVVEDDAKGTALAQIKEKNYADKYRGSGVPIHLVGVEFSRETRNLINFEYERA